MRRRRDRRQDHGATGDGSTSDLAAIQDAAAAALGANRALYFPEGVYSLGGSQWQVPDGLHVCGDGGLDKKSWIQGYVLVGGDQTFDDLLIGSKTDRALGWKNTAGRFSNTDTPLIDYSPIPPLVQP